MKREMSAECQAAVALFWQAHGAYWERVHYLKRCRDEGHAGTLDYRDQSYECANLATKLAHLKTRALAALENDFLR